MAAEALHLQSPAGEARVLVLPLTSADGIAIGRLLEVAGLVHRICRDISELCDSLKAGAGSVILAEESVISHSAQLLACLAEQPMWSELPIIILSQSGRESHALTEIMPRLGNVSVVERPMRTSTLLSLIRSNLRARERQYQLRDFLKEHEQLLESERFARSDAERAGRIKDEFLATLSHELRTPLNAVLGWTRVLRKGQGLSDELINGLTVIERNARSQAQIIGDLLDMSSIISGKVRLEVQPLDLATLIEATVETVRPAADAKGIQLRVQLAPAVSSVLGDASRLQQVFWNLLANAVKFTPQGGEVAVRLSQERSQVEVAVTDTGEGIDRAFLPHIFERFRQADASSTRRHGGLGLGLSIVRQLVELHGGVVSAHSAGTGTGSMFCIRFPVATARLEDSAPTGPHPALDIPAMPVEELRTVDLAGLKILVVDDEPDSRSLIERLLQECQASVVTAASADEAMLAMAIDVPHLMVSDIGMPGTDGYTLVRRVRALGDLRAKIPAIAVTAYVREEDKDLAARAGFQAHLCKPVDAAELQCTVERLARRGNGNAGRHPC